MSESPTGWKLVEIRDVVKSFRTIDPRKFPTDMFTYVDISSIDNQKQTISDPKTFLGKDAPSRARRVISSGDTLFSTVRTYLKNIALVSDSLDSALTSTGICILRPCNFIDPRYLFHWVRSDEFVNSMSKSMDGTLYPAVTDGDVYSGRIAVPPLNEQRRIVAKLDSLFARSRRAREELARVSGLCDRYRQAVLAAACSGRLTADWREENSKVEPWHNNSLGSVIQNIRYGTSKKCDYSRNLTPVLRIPNIGDGYIIHDDIKYAEFDSKEIAGLQLQLGDILIIRSNGSLDLVGKPAIVSNREVGFLYAGYLIRLRPNCETVLPQYLYYHLIEPGTRSQIELLAKSTSGVNNINSQELQSLSLNIPGLQEQKEIVRRVEKLFKAIDLMEQEYQKASQLCDRLEQATLAKAFRGELIAQDPNDEPASALLERILAERQNQPTGKAIKSKKLPSRGM